MLYRIMLSFCGFIIAMAATATQVQAVSLGKIDVASHLGEPFYAEVPLTLDSGEAISSMYVELASPADYKILEVYRDQALNSVRADVENDSRGARVELSSSGSIDSPFFNLILKVRYGRATHYKKYPVFLDLPKATKPTANAAPVPTITAEEAAVNGPVSNVAAVEEMVSAQDQQQDATASTSSFKPYDGWARTGHYGPMVYGDTISTVADRLRVDDRYTRNQVMVAIFEKNKGKFDQNNINLIKAGTHLDVPLAAEVERIRPDQAREIMRDHNQRWHDLMKQPRYAAVAEAQKNRYSKRVRAGNNATGVAVSPVSGTVEEGAGEESQAGQPSVTPVQNLEAGGSESGRMDGKSAAEIAALSESVSKLEQENESLKARLAESDAKISALSAKADNEDVKAAAEARVKKLELQLVRLQAELDDAKQNVASTGGPDWLMLLGGGFALLLLGGGAGYLMRRERAHPAMVEDKSFATDSYAGQIPVTPEMPEIPEVEVEEIDVDSLEDLSAEPSMPMFGEADAETETETLDFSDEFTDSIPDLTDEETGEMEAFKEDIEDEPDPNVDYLSEADVYMRYGMEDEAEKQVQMALKLKENNKDAHVKLVQIRKARGDKSGADEAIATARMVLAGDSLSTFESTIANISTGENATEDVTLEDTIPPGTLDVASDSEAEASIDDATELGFGDIEFDQGELSMPAASETAEPAEAMEFGDFEFPMLEEAGEAEVKAEEPEAKAEGEIPVETESVEMESTVEYKGDDGLDFDLSGLEIPDEAVEESVAPQESKAEAAENVGLEKMEDDGLNLSDFDLSDEAAEEPSDIQEEEVQTADLDKTLVMDWAKDTVTSGDFDIGGESGAGVTGLSFDLEAPEEDEGAAPLPVEEITVEETAVEEPSVEAEPEEHLSSVEFDLEDLDVDLEAKVSSDDVDDFSSTIQTSTAEIEASGSKPEVEPTESESDDLDISLADDSDSAPAGGNSFAPEEFDHEATVRINADSFNLEDFMGKSTDGEFDATLELDSLMNELGKDEDQENKSKKS